MFTGIIEATGLISYRQLQHGENGQHQGILHVQLPFSDLVLGESIAIQGVCLTVSEILSESVARFHVSAETLSLSNLAEANTVNVERSLKMGDRISGHWVQGHVDGTGHVSEISKNGENHLISITLPENILPYAIPKGSVTINGVSLTINQINQQKSCIFMNIVPHTWKITQLKELKVGDKVNIEADILSKTLIHQIKNMEHLCRNY